MNTAPGFRGRLIGVVVVFAIAIAAVGVLLSGARVFDTGAKYRFQAVLPSAVTLVSGSDVRKAGVQVGKVTEVANRGPTAVVAVALDADEGPIYRDATVVVRAKTLLGESYLELDPGQPAAGKVRSGGDLPVAQAKDAVQLDEILDKFDAPRRARLRRLLKGLGDGFGDHGGGDLNAFLGAAPGAVDEFAPVASALAAEREELGTLVADLGTVFAGLGRQREALQRAAIGTVGAARAFNARQAALRDTLRELDPTLRAVRATSRHTATLAGVAPPVLDDLGDALLDLKPALRAAPRMRDAVVPAFRRLGTVAPRLRKLASAAKGLSTDAPPAVRQLGELTRGLRPLAALLGRYRYALRDWLTAFGRSAYEFDGISHSGFLGLYVSTTLLATLSNEDRKLVEALLKVGALGLLTRQGVNPYPPPGRKAYTDGTQRQEFKEPPRDPPIGQPLP